MYDHTNEQSNWLFEQDKQGFCAPFVHGTQFGEDFLVCPLSVTQDGLYGKTQSGATSLKIETKEEMLCGHFVTPIDNGPRIGLQMNLNLLDLPSQHSWKQQCMPKMIYVDESYQYAYFVFATADRRYMILTVSSPLAAWRIQYSYEGHRMIGFQLLTQADDVRTDGRKELPVVYELHFQIQFAEKLSDCLPKIASVLQKAIVVPKISGGPVGATIPFEVLGDCAEMIVIDPEGVSAPLQGNTISIAKSGMYQLVSTTKTGDTHITRLLCHDSWQNQFDKITQFYRTHLQHECGAFYRGITSDTYQSNMDAIGGCSLGDPFSHYSCRSGEFGGFAAWAILKNEMLFGKKEELHQSVERYIYHWLLNRGHEDTPYLGSLYKKPYSYLGRDYGAYHMFEEYNYMQHEIFLLEELADFYKFTHDQSVLEDAMHVVDHIEQEHLLEDGTLLCQNFPDEAGVDYTTVHIPVQGFLRWVEILKDTDPERTKQLCAIAEKIADHVCCRGLDFPTEGEQCTEDGSMGCAVATLLYAYNAVSPKPEYLRVAKEILDAHHVLELEGTDCRMKNSTIRFWETQYETRQWGASINAGHAWTIWTAEAKAALALLQHDYSLLQEVYEGFLTNISKVSPEGGMYCCYTPDMIPGTCHAYWLDNMTDQTLEHNDLRPTTTHLGMTNPKGFYTTSGNYYLIKSAEIWSTVSGLNLKDNTAINGVWDGKKFSSSAPQFACLVLCGNGKEELEIDCNQNQQLEILTDGSQIEISGADIVEQSENRWVVLCQNNKITICTENEV